MFVGAQCSLFAVLIFTACIFYASKITIQPMPIIKLITDLQAV